MPIDVLCHCGADAKIIIRVDYFLNLHIINMFNHGIVGFCKCRCGLIYWNVLMSVMSKDLLHWNISIVPNMLLYVKGNEPNSSNVYMSNRNVNRNS